MSKPLSNDLIVRETRENYRRRARIAAEYITKTYRRKKVSTAELAEVIFNAFTISLPQGEVKQ